MGVEPSCTAVLRSDSVDLFPENDGYSCRTQASDLANVHCVTLAQLLTGAAAVPGEYSARAAKLPEVALPEAVKTPEAPGVGGGG